MMCYHLLMENKVLNGKTEEMKMKTQVDNVKKEERPYFKDGVIKAINGKGNVYFTLDKAIIETREPYFMTDEALSEKSAIKKAVNKFLADFRVYQFERGA